MDIVYHPKYSIGVKGRCKGTLTAHTVAVSRAHLAAGAGREASDAAVAAVARGAAPAGRARARAAHAHAAVRAAALHVVVAASWGVVRD